MTWVSKNHAPGRPGRTRCGKIIGYDHLARKARLVVDPALKVNCGMCLKIERPR